MASTEHPSDFAALFDMDGVLVDSVGLNWHAINQALAPHNVQVRDAQIHRYLGRTLEDQVAMFNDNFGLQLDFDEFQQTTEAIKVGLLPDLKPMAGVIETLEAFTTAHVPMAVGSNSPRTHVQGKLSTAGIWEYFDLVLSKDEVARPKPHSEIYERAAEGLGYATARCVVFEDSPIGVTAAKRAGTLCIAVESAYVDPKDLFEADAIIASLTAVNVATIRQLID